MFGGAVIAAFILLCDPDHDPDTDGCHADTMAISRAREFEADKAGAEISRDPAALAGALKKIMITLVDSYAPAEQHPKLRR